MDAYRYLAQAYNNLMSDVDYNAWAAYINKLIGRGEQRILETSCGTGSISSRLYDMGHEVVASDISCEMLQIAMDDARQNGREIVFVQQDMRQINAGKRFGAVVSACDGVNYLDSVGLTDFLSSAHGVLKTNGRLLFDISSAYKLKSMDGQVYYDDGEDATCIWHNRFDSEHRRLKMDIVLFMRNEGVYEKMTEQHVQYAHDKDVVMRMLASAGFHDIQAYEAFTTEQAGEQSDRIQFVCRKD